MENLSHLFSGFSELTGGESESAGNGISPAPPFSAPGSVSENTSREDVTGTPGPVVPPVSDHSTADRGDGVQHNPAGWRQE